MSLALASVLKMMGHVLKGSRDSNSWFFSFLSFFFFRSQHVETSKSTKKVNVL